MLLSFQATSPVSFHAGTAKLFFAYFN